MVSRTTTASQGILCLSVYGLVYGTFAMSAVVPAVWLPWAGFALQPPFALCLRLLLLYPARLWIRGAWDQTVPPSSFCVVPCSRMAHPRKRTISASITTGFLFLTVVVSFWIARVDRCRTDAVLAMHPALAGVGASCGKIQPVPRQKLFERCNRIKSEDNQAPTHRTSNNQRKCVSLLCDLVCESTALFGGYTTFKKLAS